MERINERAAMQPTRRLSREQESRGGKTRDQTRDRVLNACRRARAPRQRSRSEGLQVDGAGESLHVSPRLDAL